MPARAVGLYTIKLKVGDDLMRNMWRVNGEQLDRSQEGLQGADYQQRVMLKEGKSWNTFCPELERQHPRRQKDRPLLVL